MDDFLHNLRTSKRFERNRKPHDGKFPIPDRQRRESGDGILLKTISEELLPALKAILEGIAESQKRMADAAERRIAAEERKAEAMEAAAKSFKELFSEISRQKEDVQPPRRKTRAKAQPEENLIQP